MAKKSHRRKANVVAKDLFTPKYKPKTEAKMKGKGSYNRKKKDQIFDKELLKSSSFLLGSHQRSLLLVAV